MSRRNCTVHTQQWNISRNATYSKMSHNLKRCYNYFFFKQWKNTAVIQCKTTVWKRVFLKHSFVFIWGALLCCGHWSREIVLPVEVSSRCLDSQGAVSCRIGVLPFLISCLCVSYAWPIPFSSLLVNVRIELSNSSKQHNCEVRKHSVDANATGWGEDVWKKSSNLLCHEISDSAETVQKKKRSAFEFCGVPCSPSS